VEVGVEVGLGGKVGDVVGKMLGVEEEFGVRVGGGGAGEQAANRSRAAKKARYFMVALRFW